MAETVELATITEVTVQNTVLDIFTYYDKNFSEFLHFFIIEILGMVGTIQFLEGELGYTIEGLPNFSANVSNRGELVINDLDTDSYFIDDLGYLIEGEVLPAPIADAASNVLAISFTANWETVTGATGYYLDISTDPQFDTYVTGYQNKDMSTALTCDVTGLTVDTTYYYRVRAADAVQTSLDSNIISVFTTLGNVVTIDTTLNGTFSITLQGTGTVVVLWGDGTSDTVALSGTDSVVTHAYTSGGTIQITNPLNITSIFSNNKHITNIDGLQNCLNIISINFNYNLLTTFDTYAEWINITHFFVNNNLLTSLTTYAEWVLLDSFSVGNNQLTSLTTYAEWIHLRYLYANGNQLTLLTTHVEWINLSVLDVLDNQLTSLTTYAEWVNLGYLFVGQNQLTSLTTHVEWTQLQILSVTDNLLTSLTTHVEWINLTQFDVSHNLLTSLTVYTEWSAIFSITATYNAIVVADINDILIKMDTLGLSNSWDVIALDSGTNAAPTGLGITAKNNLLARTVQVTTN